MNTILQSIVDKALEVDRLHGWPSLFDNWPSLFEGFTLELALLDSFREPSIDRGLFEYGFDGGFDDRDDQVRTFMLLVVEALRDERALPMHWKHNAANE